MDCVHATLNLDFRGNIGLGKVLTSKDGAAAELPGDIAPGY